MGDDKYERILIGTNGVRYRRRRPPLPPEQDDPPPSTWLPPNAPDESAPALALTDAQVERLLRDGMDRGEPDAGALERIRRRLPLGGEP